MNKILSLKSATRLAVGLTVLLVAGCADDVERKRVIKKMETVCNADNVDKRAEFILQCIANANPKSDEEPEDWITECRKIAEATYCKESPALITEIRGPGTYWKVHKVEILSN